MLTQFMNLIDLFESDEEISYSIVLNPRTPLPYRRSYLYGGIVQREGVGHGSGAGSSFEGDGEGGSNFMIKDPWDGGFFDFMELYLEGDGESYDSTLEYDPEDNFLGHFYRHGGGR